MKKLTTLMLGMALAFTTVAVSFGQDAPPAPAKKEKKAKKAKKAPKKKDEAPKKDGVR